eukprot:gene40252-54432_t
MGRHQDGPAGVLRFGREQGITRRARPLLQPAARLVPLPTQDAMRHAEARTESGDTLRFRGGVGAQAMVDGRSGQERRHQPFDATLAGAAGAATEVLWVKGSGGDLRTSTRENFSSLYQQKLIAMQSLYGARADKGLKSQAEDDMVGMQAHATFNLNPRASSIDTPLHSFLPGKHVDHMHPNAIIAIAASQNCEKLTKEIFGGEMAYVPWMRPGFELGLAMQAISKANPKTQAIMMGQHGFISWADDDKACYTLTLDFIEKASAYIEAKYAAKGGDAAAFGGQKYATLDEAKRRATFAAILPWLRGQVSKEKRFIGTVQDDAKILRFVNSKDAA